MGNWTAVKDGLPPEHCGRLLVTNNPESRTAFGHHSHLWLVGFIHKDDDGSSYSGFCAYTDSGSKVWSVTHWRYAIPEEAPTHGGPENER